MTLTCSFWTATKRVPAHVTIENLDNGQRRLVTTVRVENKREARKVAKSMNAEPWNF